MTTAVLALLLISCTEVGNGNDKIINYVGVGDRVPPFTVTNGDNTLASPSDFTGNTTILVFFHTACPDGEREMPKVQEAWEELKDLPDCRAAAIGRGQTNADLDEKWIYGDIPRFGDPDSKIFNKFANLRIPRLYIVDSQGVIRYMAIETWKKDGEELTAAGLKEIFLAVRGK